MIFSFFKLIPGQNWVGRVRATTFQIGMALPYVLCSELEAELIQLEAAGIVVISTSPCASGLVLVSKKDGGLQVCVYYRGIKGYYT